jgi:hypothetical protein
MLENHMIALLEHILRQVSKHIIMHVINKKLQENEHLKILFAMHQKLHSTETMESQLDHSHFQERST